jgi:hypothetical protein
MPFLYHSLYEKCKQWFKKLIEYIEMLCLTFVLESHYLANYSSLMTHISYGRAIPPFPHMSSWHSA